MTFPLVCLKGKEDFEICVCFFEREKKREKFVKGVRGVCLAFMGRVLNG